ncbi:MAG: hypothetical protein ISQ13_04290 [Candidatus Margulisbacteria bacterium]|nr:hypothetical protein [Candidatus Margulisiibacteriota bacterium]
MTWNKPTFTKLKKLDHTFLRFGERIRQWLAEHWLALIPVIVLHAIAWRQITLRNMDHLDAWKGGGFGMFSTIGDRFYHIHLMTNKTFECSETPKGLRKKLSKTKKYPSYMMMESVAKELAEGTWVYDYKIKRDSASVVMLGRDEPLTQHHRMVRFDSVELQVFSVRFNKETFTLEPRLLRKLACLK